MKTIDDVIQKLEYIMESDPRTFSNPKCEYGWMFHRINEAIKMLKEIEKELPSAQPGEDIRAMCGECDAWNQYKNYPQPRWIPVTERLPENGRQVLVYARGVHYSLAKYDEMRDADGVYRKQWVTFDAWKPFYTIKEVIAWCELPQYEGRQDDKY